jgi:hypothetical protein
MPEETQGTLNGSSGVSSSPAMSSDGDLISTIGLTTSPPATDTSGKDAKTEAPGTAEDKTEPDKDKGADGGNDGEDRFDKHPRFVKLNDRVKAAEKRVAELEQLVNNEKTKATAEGNTETEALPFKDTRKMSKDDLLDWQAEDPQGYHDNLVAQAKFELAKDMKADQKKNSVEDAIAKTYEAYAKENPDFDEMWDSGDIREYMSKNPGHNAISAHMAMTSNKKVEKAVKDAEKRIMENLRAKRESQVIPAGPSASRASSETEIPTELKDTKKHGGLAAVLARRSQEREQRRFGG